MKTVTLILDIDAVRAEKAAEAFRLLQITEYRYRENNVIMYVL